MSKHVYDHPRPAVTVDIAILMWRSGRLQSLLVRRGKEPFIGKWALPGGFVGMDESLDEAAARELAEETGLTGIPLIQIKAYGAPDRDPRGRVITVAYATLLPSHAPVNVQAGSDAGEVSWFPIDKLPELAFDHQEIVQDAIDQIQPQPRDHYS